MTGLSHPRVPTVKTLFAASNNACSYTGCEEKLTDPEWQEVNGEVCHIAGERPGAARFDASMSDEERHSYDNLILLCPKHHKLIDRLELQAHPISRLQEMKAAADSRSEPWKRWTTSGQLDRIAEQVDAVLLAAALTEPVVVPVGGAGHTTMSGTSKATVVVPAGGTATASGTTGSEPDRLGSGGGRAFATGATTRPADPGAGAAGQATATGSTRNAPDRDPQKQ